MRDGKIKSIYNYKKEIKCKSIIKTRKLAVIWFTRQTTSNSKTLKSLLGKSYKD